MSAFFDDPYGNILAESNQSYRGRYGWDGREMDVETGLIYERARYYDPFDGRWISQDPLGFDAGDSNLYRYVHNQPTDFSDPSGFQSSPISPSVEEAINGVLGLGAAEALSAKNLSVKALTTTEKKFPESDLHNDEADAWRHAYWSALMANKSILIKGYRPKGGINLEYWPAYLAGLGHEFAGAKVTPKQPGIEAAMDLHNNNVGLRIGTALKKDSPDQVIIDAVDEALKNKELIWITGKGNNARLTGPASFQLVVGDTSSFNIGGVFVKPTYATITVAPDGSLTLPANDKQNQMAKDQLERLRIIGGYFR